MPYIRNRLTNEGNYEFLSIDCNLDIFLIRKHTEYIEENLCFETDSKYIYCVSMIVCKRCMKCFMNRQLFQKKQIKRSNYHVKA